MKTLVELVSVVGGLLWPMLAFVIFLTYRNEFKVLLQRVRKGKILGQEIELENSLTQLQHVAEAAATEVAASEAESARLTLPEAQVSDTAETIRQILNEAARSPKVGLLLLSAELERQVRYVLSSAGWHAGRDIRSFRQGFDVLNRLKIVPANVASSVRLFLDIRDRLVHGGNATDDDVLRAIDSGVTILKAIASIPHEKHIVYAPLVELFSDPEGRHVIEGVHGVMLESISPGGAVRRQSIFPTTKSHFKRGKEVAWEWSLGAGLNYGPAWFRHPETGEIKEAWSRASEFIGRHLDEI